VDRVFTAQDAKRLVELKTGKKGRSGDLFVNMGQVHHLALSDNDAWAAGVSPLTWAGVKQSLRR